MRARHTRATPLESLTTTRGTEVGALVIGGEYRGLGVARSLGRNGIPVWVLIDEHDVAAASRFARHSLPWPRGQATDQVQFLLDLARNAGLEGWVVFPTGDETSALVAQHRDALAASYCLTTPPWDIFQWAYDKRLMNQLAQSVDVPIPRTAQLTQRRDVADIRGPFPVILKPAIKSSFNQFTHAKAWRADDRATLLARYDVAASLIDPRLIMIQELIPGGGSDQYSYAALCHDGRPVSSVTARRLRQFPVDFGRASTFVETVECAEVECAARRLLERLRYTGLIEVEFKRDGRDGQFKLLDLNPRVWGWHTLARRAGVDLPYLAFQLARGDEPLPSTARLGVHWMRVLTDAPAAVIDIVGGRLSVLDYLRSFRGELELSCFAFDDPWPAIVEIPGILRLATRRKAI